jgi:hypothetical protein
MRVEGRWPPYFNYNLVRSSMRKLIFVSHLCPFFSVLLDLSFHFVLVVQALLWAAFPGQTAVSWSFFFGRGSHLLWARGGVLFLSTVSLASAKSEFASVFCLWFYLARCTARSFFEPSFQCQLRAQGCFLLSEFSPPSPTDLKKFIFRARVCQQLLISPSSYSFVWVSWFWVPCWFCCHRAITKQ